MAETGIRFITFGISPYCEKARWALDWHRIPYREIGWPPGLHQILAKRCGAKSSALPILLEGTQSFRGAAPSSIGRRGGPRITHEASLQGTVQMKPKKSNGAATRLSLCMFGVSPSPRCCRTMRTS